MVDREKILRVMDYDPLTGLFTWKRRDPVDGDIPAKVASWNTRYSGKLSGCENNGYVLLSIDNRKYYAQRIAWIIERGPIPDGMVIDHINGNGLDNRIDNLRVACKRVNALNTVKIRNNKTGLTGVVALPSGRFMAQRNDMGKKRYLGSFDTAEEAHQAYLKSRYVA